MLYELDESEEMLELKERVEAVVEQIKAVMARVAEIVAPAIKRFVELAKPYIDALTEAAILYISDRYPKWWHYYKHAKRRRIRKKYRDKLLREVAAMIEKGIL